MQDVPPQIRLHTDETGHVVDLLIQLGQAAHGDFNSPAAATVQASPLRAARIALTLAQEVAWVAARFYPVACGKSDPPLPISPTSKHNSQGSVCN